MKLSVLLSLLLLSQFPNLAVSSELVNNELQKAKSFFQQGEYEKAISKYEKLAKTDDPGLAFEANLGLGLIFIQKGDYEKAEKISRKNLETFPDHPDALTFQGRVFKRTGKYKNARAKFRQALDQNPDHLLARLNFGRMQWEWGAKNRCPANAAIFNWLLYKPPEFNRPRAANYC